MVGSGPKGQSQQKSFAFLRRAERAASCRTARPARRAGKPQIHLLTQLIGLELLALATEQDIIIIIKKIGHHKGTIGGKGKALL